MPRLENIVAELKRRSDPEDDHVDHRQDRRFDWRELAPRWALVTAVVMLLSSTFFLWGRYIAADDERIAVLARYQSDERWNLLSKLSEEQATQRARLNHHDAQLQQLTKLADDISDIRADVRALKRLAEEQRGR